MWTFKVYTYGRFMYTLCFIILQIFNKKKYIFCSKFWRANKIMECSRGNGLKLGDIQVTVSDQGRRIGSLTSSSYGSRWALSRKMHVLEFATFEKILKVWKGEHTGIIPHEICKHSHASSFNVSCWDMTFRFA